MRQRIIPILAPATKRRQNSDGCSETKARGLAVLNSPMLNKGTAFTAEERQALGLRGLLPPDISTLETRPPRGVYLSIDHAEAIEEAFINLGVGPGDIDLILATDAEQILGIGDWGVGGSGGR
jgi:hypothetical protein